MAPEYINSRFFKPYKRLMYMGAWTPDMFSKKSHKRLFYLYTLMWLSAMVTAIIIQLTDLYLVLGNFRKMSFNLCSSTAVIAISVKMFFLLKRRKELRSLTYRLWEDSIKYNDEEDVTILDTAYKRFNYNGKILYSGPLTVIPVWGFASYFSYMWGERFLPFAGYFPMDDMNNDVTYVPALIFEVIMAFYTVQTVLESDLTMIGLGMQIEAHFQILSKNIKKLNESCERCRDNALGEEFKREVNTYLRSERIQSELKTLVKRHMELLGYCEDVENIFNRCMAVQLLGGSFLITMNGIETTRTLTKISLPLCYQMMYLIFMLIDVYVICNHFTTLATECTNVGFAAYDSLWYNMDVRVRQMLCLIMTRAQKPPRFTYGKLFVIDVNAYMHLVKNIYSWLMLFRQLEMK